MTNADQVRDQLIQALDGRRPMAVGHDRHPGPRTPRGPAGTAGLPRPPPAASPGVQQRSCAPRPRDPHAAPGHHPAGDPPRPAPRTTGSRSPRTWVCVRGRCQARQVVALPPLQRPLLGPDVNQVSRRRQDERRQRQLGDLHGLARRHSDGTEASRKKPPRAEGRPPTGSQARSLAQ